jgi:DNA-binding NtrC family response regulator
VGGTNLLGVDVRVVSASNKDLRDEVTAGRFREDLLYRLNVVSIHMPSLRDRPEDIPILASYFLERKAKSKNVKSLSSGALAMLQAHTWPGNVRELEHVIEGAILLSSGDVIEEYDLAMYFQRGDRPGVVTPAAQPAPAGPPITLDDLERQHIESTLRTLNFNRARTAEALGISKKTLYLKLKRYGMGEQE